MRKGRSIAVLVAGLLGPLTSAFAGEESPIVELTTPRPPGLSDAIQLQVKTGGLPRGGRLRLLTEQSEFLGSVVPFGPRLGGGSITGTVPVPRSAITNGRLRLRLEVVEPGAPPRPPRPGEVESLNLVVVPQAE
jgi:hypothetical protein